MAQRFLIASLLILLAGMLGIGRWVGEQIKEGVIHSTAATTALYVDSFVAPQLQDLADGREPSAGQIAALGRLLDETPLGREIVAFKVWDAQGRILYSKDSTAIGQVFPVEGELALAWQGEVTAHLSELEKAENVLERAQEERLLEVYSPVRIVGSDRIIAVAEFYQRADALSQEIAGAQRRSWLVVALATLTMYVLLGWFVQRLSNTIGSQQAVLDRQVAHLTTLLGQNEELNERVRRAAGRSAALNERFLRRIGAELHDGPAQYIGLALLRLDSAIAHYADSPGGRRRQTDAEAALDVVQRSLAQAMQEIRSISAGMGLPQIERLTLAETIAAAVRAHERRTQTSVVQHVERLPEQAPMPIKITLYRVIQEALTNAFRHAGGQGQQVRALCHDEQIQLEVADAGPGLEPGAAGSDQHLGLVGMRERVESLGGQFAIEGAPDQGTRVLASLPLQIVDD